MIIGASKCTHSWDWFGPTEIKCTKCFTVSKGHDRKPGSAYCFNCKENH